MSVALLEAIRGVLVGWLDSGLGASWVVAVSGGSDSVAMLRVLDRLGPGLGLRLSVAHLDHGVRGESARADAEFVADLAGALGLPIDLGHWHPARAGHFEADARRARYAWLAEVARARGASVVAVGHTRDDQAETILHRVLRGTGPRGLSGMPARRPLDDSATLVRPLLGVDRLDLRAFLDEIGQPYRDDASNADGSRTRARIRHDLLPRLAREYNPRVAEALVRLGGLATEWGRDRDRLVASIERRASMGADPDRVVLRRRALRPWPPTLRADVLRLAWRRLAWPEAGMGAEHWGRLAALASRRDARASFPGGIVAESSGDRLTLTRTAAPRDRDVTVVPGEPRTLAIPGEVAWDLGRVVATLDPEAPRDESVDLDCLAEPIWVRAPRPGDRFAPLGMGGKSQPLNDFFRGRHVPRVGRGHVPLVCDGRGILWVVGHRIDHRARMTESTRRTLGLRWDPDRKAGTGSASGGGCD